MVLAIGFQLSSSHTPPVTLREYYNDTFVDSCTNQCDVGIIYKISVVSGEYLRNETGSSKTIRASYF